MRILSIHQPAYLPWLGYFDRIARSDMFVFLDSVQFEKNSFINRNRIKSPNGPLWLTIPVKTKGHLNSTLIETEIDNRQDWSHKHLKTIQTCYRKAPRYEECYPRLEALYARHYERLADLCYNHLLFWLKELKITTEIIRASTLPLSLRKSDLILEICQQLGATHYISGRLGQGYLNLENFASLGISLEFQSFHHPIYPQIYGGFLPNMGIIDLWMNRIDHYPATGASL